MYSIHCTMCTYTHAACTLKCKCYVRMSTLTMHHSYHYFFDTDSTLTIKLLEVMPYLVPDHKLLPAPERMMQVIPVSC